MLNNRIVGTEREAQDVLEKPTHLKLAIEVLFLLLNLLMFIDKLMEQTTAKIENLTILRMVSFEKNELSVVVVKINTNSHND